ncbi:5-dehydro-4-deoxy-D-glucuronate isomerase [Flaviaesturariibacter amylovorans]|uniref:4-deoxy-L-threo-5-hexosulose-uronate ketol-isomerase n=1 Tax=Flaviaesturariibacter amylovorans TaxID=1084520 RepID=A0ABP8GBW9_9BACT
MLERFACSPAETLRMDTAQLREHFLLPELFVPDSLQATYTHYDRMIVGAAVPATQALELPAYEALRATYFLERRELGIINIGGAGSVEADGERFPLGRLDCLYVGRGTRSVIFHSDDASAPARFYLLSAPAHVAYPTRLMTAEAAQPAPMGATATANERIIYKYIHEAGIPSCQLVMGLTVLRPGSVWNTMPAHTHHRRMEAYLYFDVQPEHRVFHLLGTPQETRHLVVANEQAVLSPPWSIHSGCGTAAYAFIWGMAGENQSFADMDALAIADLK